MFYYTGFVLFVCFYCLYFCVYLFTSYLYMHVKRFEMLPLKALYKIKFIIIIMNVDYQEVEYTLFRSFQ